MTQMNTDLIKNGTYWACVTCFSNVIENVNAIFAYIKTIEKTSTVGCSRKINDFAEITDSQRTLRNDIVKTVNHKCDAEMGSQELQTRSVPYEMTL